MNLKIIIIVQLPTSNRNFPMFLLVLQQRPIRCCVKKRMNFEVYAIESKILKRWPKLLAVDISFSSIFLHGNYIKASRKIFGEFREKKLF
jgi:hypothetical protein